MKLYRKLDEQGMFVEDVLLDSIPYLMQTVTETVTNEDGTTTEVMHDEVPVLSPYYIETECPQGFYKPKWNGTEWIEGGQPPTPQPQEPSTEERLQSLEDAMLFLTLGGM